MGGVDFGFEPDDAVTFSKTLRDEKEYLKTRVFEMGGRNLIAGTTLDYHVGYTRGSFEMPYDINSNFDNTAAGVATYDNTTHPCEQHDRG